MDDTTRAHTLDEALDVAYEELSTKGCFAELPQWAWNTLIDSRNRAEMLNGLRDVNAVAMSPAYWNRVYVVYREVECWLWGTGPTEIAYMDFASLYQV